MLCQTKLPPRCTCEGGAQDLCPGQWTSRDGWAECPRGVDGFATPTSKNGDPCTGMTRVVSGGARSIAVSGKLNCRFCYGHEAGHAGIHGGPCTGIAYEGVVKKGTWDCAVHAQR
jgi:hypothetical protein